jgi:hypothetical protein
MVALFGCGSGKLATVKVSGTVTFEGQPLAGAMVNFSPKTAGAGHPGYAVTDTGGRYKLQTLLGNPDAGTTPGEYDVYIVKMEETPPTDSGLAGGSSATVFRPPPKSLIPDRYSSTATSGLTATVKNKNNVIDFELTN